MMTKADILNEIGLEELSGTEFENLMVIKKLSEEGIIERSKTNILIKDKIKLENYKKKLTEKMWLQ